MTDAINRIGPSTIAPERYPVSRRDRDEKNRQEPHQKDDDKQKTFPLPPANKLVDAHDELTETPKDKTKGQILDLDA
jgi:hypothetical protein